MSEDLQRQLREANALLRRAPAEALQKATAILGDHPGLGPAMLLSAQARTRLKQFGVAMSALKSCHEVQPGFVPCLFEMGRAFERLGNRPAAMKAYEEVVVKHPGSAEAIQARHRLGR